MDDHYYQPLWPMMQGALDYILNLAGEGWSMIWKQVEEPVQCAVKEMSEHSSQEEATVQAASMSIHAFQGRNIGTEIQENERGG